MITPSFNFTATERVLPKLALDFTTASLDPKVTFTRTTSATNPAMYVNSSGVLTAAADNQPRFDHNPITLACKGLLIEESRTNIFTYSQDFSNAYWTRSGVNAFGSGSVADATTAPDGTTTADYIQLTGMDGSLYTPVSGITGTITQSIFAKAAEATSMYLLYANSSIKAVFNLSNGTVTSQANGTASITAFPDGWYRCTFTPTTTTSSRTYIGCTGTAGQGIYIWGAQLEAGAFATSYIPTTSAALTRNADVATMTGTNFSDWYNASEGTFLTQATAITTTGAVIVSANNTTSGNRMFMTASLPGNTGSAGRIDVGGVAQAVFGNFSYIGNDKIIMAYKANNFAASVNGATISADTSGTVPIVSQLEFCRQGAYSAFYSATIKKVFYWPQRLTNAEVQAFSK